MRKTVGDRLGVKASGGIRDRKTLIQMIEAGANRIGTSSGVSPTLEAGICRERILIMEYLARRTDSSKTLWSDHSRAEIDFSFVVIRAEKFPTIKSPPG